MLSHYSFPKYFIESQYFQQNDWNYSGQMSAVLRFFVKPRAVRQQARAFTVVLLCWQFPVIIANTCWCPAASTLFAFDIFRYLFPVQLFSRSEKLFLDFCLQRGLLVTMRLRNCAANVWTAIWWEREIMRCSRVLLLAIFVYPESVSWIQ